MSSNSSNFIKFMSSNSSNFIKFLSKNLVLSRGPCISQLPIPLVKALKGKKQRLGVRQNNGPQLTTKKRPTFYLLPPPHPKKTNNTKHKKQLLRNHKGWIRIHVFSIKRHWGWPRKKTEGSVYVLCVVKRFYQIKMQEFT